MRLVVPVLLLAACADDPPALRVAVGADGIVSIALIRAPDHAFAQLSATANDLDLGAPALFAGDEGVPSSGAPSGAMAVFEVPLAELGTGARIVVIEGSERFEAAVPTIGAFRAINVQSLPMPLRAGDWIEVASGVDDDVLGGGFTMERDDSVCNTQWATAVREGFIAFQVAPDLQQSWSCGAPGAPGSQGGAIVSLGLSAYAPMTCDGAGVECGPVQLPTMRIDLPVTVQF